MKGFNFKMMGITKLKTGLIFSLIILLTPVYAEISPETMVNVFERLDALEKKVRELNGENEVLKHQISELKKEQKTGFLNVDERFEKLSSKTTREAPTSLEKEETDAKVKIIDTTENNDTKLESPKEKVRVVNKNTRVPTSYEKETYQAAYALMKTSPSAATKSFQEYIKMQPNSPLAANAQYWIGEIMYSHNNYKGAIDEFIKVLQLYKHSNKAPDAAIKLGYSFYALKNWPYARRTFDDVIKYFPENEKVVKLARKRLEKMTAAGH